MYVSLIEWSLTHKDKPHILCSSSFSPPLCVFICKMTVSNEKLLFYQMWNWDTSQWSREKEIWHNVLFPSSMMKVNPFIIFKYIPYIHIRNITLQKNRPCLIQTNQSLYLCCSLTPLGYSILLSSPLKLNLWICHIEISYKLDLTWLCQALWFVKFDLQNTAL